MSIVVEICELVAPLGHDAKGIFEERDDNEETANRWEISICTCQPDRPHLSCIIRDRHREGPEDRS